MPVDNLFGGPLFRAILGQDSFHKSDSDVWDKKAADPKHHADEHCHQQEDQEEKVDGKNGTIVHVQRKRAQMLFFVDHVEVVLKLAQG